MLDRADRSTGRLRSGYTLVEVLIVVVVLGIAAAMIVPQMLSAGQLGVQAAARMIIADIQYAQNDAVAAQAERRLVFEPDSDRYRLTDASGQVLEVPWRSAGGARYEVSFQEDQRFRGVELVSADFDEEPVLVFDDLGAPESGGRVVLKFNDQRYEVAVAPFTGRVTVQRLADE